MIRDDPGEAGARATQAMLRPTGSRRWVGRSLLGSPAEMADALAAVTADSGFETVIVRMPAPYDRETIDRMAEVRELLDA